MSEAKAPEKGDAGPKKSEAKKPEAKQSEAKQSEAKQSEAKQSEAKKPEKAAETSSADKSPDKADAAPKSASQSSISHFSSVSTPAYRSGWNNIFGGRKTNKNKKSNTNNGDMFPTKMVIVDKDIDTELRTILSGLFQRQALNQGVRLDKIRNAAAIEYTIECNIREDR